jgi:hypothetical protein
MALDELRLIRFMAASYSTKLTRSGSSLAELFIPLSKLAIEAPFKKKIGYSGPDGLLAHI